jgi:hypothetical protein
VPSLVVSVPLRENGEVPDPGGNQLAERYYTTSTALLDALAEAGVTHIQANLGSDHPGLIEALAQTRADGDCPFARPKFHDISTKIN